MRDLYSVAKHSAPFKGLFWTVQMPKGLMTFKTKRDATIFAEQMQDEAASTLRRQHVIDRMLAE